MTRPAWIGAARALAAAAVALLGVARAQDLNLAALRDGDRHVLRLGVGVEDAAVASLGYDHLLPALGSAVALGGGIDVVPVHASNWRLRVGAAAPLARWGGWTAGASLRGILRNASNDMSRMTNLGAEASLWGGFYASRWFAAAGAGVDWAAATYIASSSAYRALVYDGARDGWYSGTGAALVYGVSAGYSFSDVDLVLRLGQRRDFDLATWFLPFYATVGVDVRFPG